MRHLGDHIHTLIRHTLSICLLAGTVSGSLFTFSSGRLSLPRFQELFISVGGIVVAIEAGAFLCAITYGELRRRAANGRTPKVREEYRRQSRTLLIWLVALIGVSMVANFNYRMQTQHNIWLAVFFAVAAALLLVVFGIVLQPLLPDFHEKARRSMQEAVVKMVGEAGSTVHATMSDLSRNKPVSPERMQMFNVALSLLSVYAPTDERSALQFAVQGYSGQGVVEADADVVYWKYQDIMQLYGVSKRSAQAWIAAAPGKRKSGRNGGTEAPRSAIEGVHGVPSTTPLLEQPQAASRPRRAASRRVVQSSAEEMQVGVEDGQYPEAFIQSVEATA